MATGISYQYKPNFMRSSFQPLLRSSPENFVYVTLKTKNISAMAQKSFETLLVF